MLEYEDELRELSERIPSSVADAEYKYMKYIKMDADRNKPSEPSILDAWKNEKTRSVYFEYKNYYANIMNHLQDKINEEFNHFRGNAFQHKELIDRCFYHNTVEEIMEALKKENSAFARECYEAMSRNSMQSMQLALAMLRRAINLDYKGCLQMELNVAFNRLQDSDFDLGVNTVLGTPRQKGSKYRNSPIWGQKLSPSEV